MSKLSTAKKIGKILWNVLIYLFLALCVFAVVITLLSGKSADGAANVFGYQMRVVVSNSMEACDETDIEGFDIGSIPLHSLIFTKTVPSDPEEAEAFYEDVEVGDVLTIRYAYTAQVTITHRVTKITEKDTGGYVIELAGDNKNADGGQLYQTIDTSDTDSPNYVLGRVIWHNHILGMFLHALDTPLGMVFVVILPCVIIILLEILKILRMVNAEKKKKAEEAEREKDLELEALKKRLAELEGKDNAEQALPQRDTDVPTDNN